MEISNVVDIITKRKEDIATQYSQCEKETQAIKERLGVLDATMKQLNGAYATLVAVGDQITQTQANEATQVVSPTEVQSDEATSAPLPGGIVEAVVAKISEVVPIDPGITV